MEYKHTVERDLLGSRGRMILVRANRLSFKDLAALTGDNYAFGCY